MMMGTGCGFVGKFLWASENGDMGVHNGMGLDWAWEWDWEGETGRGTG